MITLAEFSHRLEQGTADELPCANCGATPTVGLEPRVGNLVRPLCQLCWDAMVDRGAKVHNERHSVQDLADEMVMDNPLDQADELDDLERGDE